ncbi:phosphotransferase [Phenylobacterium sp.]|uniref:phosphotransferase n=1 Tax=Phenylobacterium sp. TaxID=1871053 RepID=UPI00272245D4|nr:phosphotransferase [Phenylobacterium sp.]MDO8377445.1 phosphotransferase [Phenylobacterium sp.]
MIELKKIRPLAGGGGAATIDLVEIGDSTFVLKRQTARHVGAERLFQRTLANANLPSLKVIDHPSLRPDEILLEYVEASVTVGRSLSLSLCERWGAAIAALHAIRPGCFMELNEAALPIAASWPDFLERTLRDGLARQRGRQDGIPSQLLDRIEKRLAPLLAFHPDEFAVAHGDLHMNNALIRGGDIVLFDKAPGIWTAPQVFDIALVVTEAFPGARYLDSQARNGDKARLAAFMSGYRGLPPAQDAWIDHFALLRSLRRYPSPFVPDMLTTIQTALDRL